LKRLSKLPRNPMVAPSRFFDMRRLSVAVLLTFAVLWVWYFNRPKPFDRSTMNTQAFFIEECIDKLAFEKPDEFAAFVLKFLKPNSIFEHGFYQEATNTLTTGMGYRGEGFKTFPSGEDPWGIPFWIRFDSIGTNNDGFHTAGRRFRYTLWSSGPNRKNEDGQGDDIVFGPYDTFVRPSKSGGVK
jgi:hypothetical protein